MAASHQHLKPDESLPPFSPFHEGISMLLSRWTALQMAVQNQWGGRDSFMKSQQLAYDINSWFSQPKVSLHVEDLENLLHERLLLSFNTEIEDGSIEEIADQLMTMHEESLHGNRLSVESNQHFLESIKDTTTSKRTDAQSLAT